MSKIVPAGATTPPEVASTPNLAACQGSGGKALGHRPMARMRSTPLAAALPDIVVTSPRAAFVSTEHMMLGNAATGSELLTELRLKDGTTLSFGEVVALSGDYVGSVEELRQLAATPEGQDEIRFARWMAVGQREPEPNVPAEAKKRVRDRYLLLAADNSNHFSHGGTAIATYKSRHAEALRKAREAGESGSEAQFAAAVTDEACAQHFLSDTFAAGHIRAPVVAIREAYRSEMPDSIRQILRYAIQRMVKHLDERGDVPLWWPRWLVEQKAVDAVEEAAGSIMDALSLGDIVALACHNADGNGLNVVSELHASGLPVPGGFHWRALGDGKMVPDSTAWRMAVASMRVSRAELDFARTTGAKNPKEPLPASYPATHFIPREDAARNPVMKWRWGAMNGHMVAAVNGCLREVLVPQLRSHHPPEVMRFDRVGRPDPEGSVVLHVGEAFEAFCREVETDGIKVLERAVKKPAASQVGKVDAA